MYFSFIKAESIMYFVVLRSEFSEELSPKAMNLNEVTNPSKLVRVFIMLYSNAFSIWVILQLVSWWVSIYFTVSSQHFCFPIQQNETEIIVIIDARLCPCNIHFLLFVFHGQYFILTAIFVSLWSTGPILDCTRNVIFYKAGNFNNFLLITKIWRLFLSFFVHLLVLGYWFLF